MADRDPEVFFEPEEIGKGDWQLRVISHGAELEYVPGFESKAEAQKWRDGPECQAWLKMRGYRK